MAGAEFRCALPWYSSADFGNRERGRAVGVVR